MLTRILESQGLFVGWKKTGTHEALFFQQLNKWLLRQSGTDMENPSLISWLLGDQEVRALAVDLIKHTMRSPRAISYLGLKRYLRYRSPADLDIAWGWKDPRSTFTLPVWLDIFPESKVIHMYRHGVDVASSLRTRRRKILARMKSNYAKFRAWYLAYLMFKVLPGKGKLVDLRPASLEGGFSLWEEYVREAKSHVRTLQGKVMEIKYEDFLEHPDDSLRGLSDFCELRYDSNAVKKTTDPVRRERAYAYQQDAELLAFEAKVRDRLQAYGY